MGIPSYYKKLCDRIPGLLSKERKGMRPTHVWVDFNCMIYHCLRRPGATPYAGEETRIEWENKLIQDVCTYLKKVVSLVNPTTQVYVAVDGVVPMAKMRQQRLRRFKSQWVAKEEVRIGKTEEGPRWDTNAITPGTAFMERLGQALKECKSSGLKWIVSGADEPGEGEHKVIQQIRSLSTDRESHVLYGLDADLILLSLLQPIKEFWLFREAIECGEVKYSNDKQEEYRYFSIHTLRNYLTNKKDGAYLLDYCMLMSLVGNDFLPHGLSLKLKDGGHEALLSILEDVRPITGPFIQQKESTDGGQYSWNPTALLEIFKWLKIKEPIWIQQHCSSKLGQRYQPARGSTPKELAVDEWNKLPLRMCEELALVHSIGRTEDHKCAVELLPTWNEIYYERWLHTETSERICAEYCIGLDWILQYYTGGPINWEWHFPWFLPPLWEDLYTFVHTCNGNVPTSPREQGIQVQPQEQLALVLPLSSWWLIRQSSLRSLPRKAPAFWPTEFILFTAGRKLVWECEAQIPLLTPAYLRYLLK
jgi:5'-3' exoribonuclease 2